jgi:hypothetical protein
VMKLTLETTSNRVYLSEPVEVVKQIGWPTDLYRQPHDKELVIPGPTLRSPNRYYRGNSFGEGRDTNNKTIPEPYRLYPEHQVPLDCGWQRLIRNCNPEHKDDVVDNVLDQAWILANNTGLGAVGRKNCRNGAYMNDPEAKWPALHTIIICGGGLLSGKVVDNVLQINSLRISDPVPTAEYVLSRIDLWFYLVELNPRGVVTFMTLSAKDGTRKPVRMPIISNKQLYAPVNWFDRIPSGTEIPSPLWMS